MHNMYLEHCWYIWYNCKWFLNYPRQGILIYLHNDLIFRIAKRRYPNKSSIPIKECGIKGYSDIPLGERDSTKAADQAGIPHYVHDWSKHNPPYISSPTLLTGYSDTCDIDKSHKQPYRDRSFSVGNREMECHDLDRIRAAACKAGSEYKTHVWWHAMWK